ncbi:MAG: hypothetical protein ACRDRX_18990 [Pseudonocardiaceae bacterium]
MTERAASEQASSSELGTVAHSGQWFLRSLGDHDTHHGQLGADGTVLARCGVSFTPRPTLQVVGPPPGELVAAGPALKGIHRTRNRSVRTAGVVGERAAMRAPGLGS